MTDHSVAADGTDTLDYEIRRSRRQLLCYQSNDLHTCDGGAVFVSIRITGWDGDVDYVQMRV